MYLLARIQAHLRRTGMTPTRFGRVTVNDPRLVRDLLRGREPRAELRGRVGAWLDRQEQPR